MKLNKTLGEVQNIYEYATTIYCSLYLIIVIIVKFNRELYLPNK
jgi:hypothetical protein